MAPKGKEATSRSSVDEVTLDDEMSKATSKQLSITHDNELHGTVAEDIDDAEEENPSVYYKNRSPYDGGGHYYAGDNGFSSSYVDNLHYIPTTVTIRGNNSVPGGSMSLTSARVVSAEDRVDPAGSYYTAYLMEVEREGWPRAIVEHRYSEFARLHAELSANDVKLRSSFPTKSLCGRLGNWTPAAHWAPEKMAELVTYRKIKLDIWVVELAELLARADKEEQQLGPSTKIITPEVRSMCLEFFQKSAAGCPPCDRANPVSWDGLKKKKGKGVDEEVLSHELVDEEEDESTIKKLETRHASGTEKLISNPVSFTLGSEIRKATYTVGHMCGRSALAADRSIPLDLLHQAKGLCFLTVIKIGCVVSGRVGTGLVIARRPDGSWSPPSAVGTIGIGYGALIGGDITSYLIVLNTERAVHAFSSRGSVNLGAELGVSVGPIGRSANGNVNAGNGGVAPAYSYAHSKGFFVGISLEGSVVASRSDVNAKFYGRPVDVGTLLFDNSSWTPRAAQPLYDALEEALETEISGFRPSHITSKHESPKKHQPKAIISDSLSLPEE